MDNLQDNIGPAVQVPDWDIAFRDFPYPMAIRMDNLTVAGEGLSTARIGELTSFVIKFTDPRYYTENLQIRIIDDATRDVVLDVVPFEVAKGYGIRAFYLMTKPGRVRLDITVDGVRIPHIPVRVEVNDDYVNALEMSNLTLLRLLNQETGRQRLAHEELQAVRNELSLLTEEIPQVCQTALQSVAQAVERSTAVVNRAKNLLQQFPHSVGQPPAYLPAAERPQDPRRNGSPPAAADTDVGNSPHHFSASQQLPTHRSSAPCSRLSPPTSEGARQPGDLKRKSGDDMGQESPTKKGRMSAPSALEGADESGLVSPTSIQELHGPGNIMEGVQEEAPTQRSSEDRASASPTRTDGSGSTDVTGELNRLLDALIMRGREVDEAQNQVPNDDESWRLEMTLSPEERPLSAPLRLEGGFKKSWSLRCSASPTPTDYENLAPCPGVVEEDDPSQCNPLEDFFAVSSSPETISSTSTKTSGEFRSSITSFSGASPVSAIRGSPCPSLSSRSGASSPRSRASPVSAIRGSPCPSLSSRSGASSPRSGASSPRSGASSPRSGASSPRSGATSPRSGATSPGSGATSPGSGATSPGSGTSSPGSGATSPGSGATSPGSGATSPGSGASSPGSGASSPRSGASSPRSGASSPRSGASSPRSGASSPRSAASSPRSAASSPRSRTSSVSAIRGSPCPSLASTDEDDSPQRNPRYNQYYWMRALPRKNYRQ